MDAIYGTQRHFYDLTRKFYLLGRDRLIRRLQPPPGGTVLEVGCGTGRNLIAVARAYPQSVCHGFDISTAMLKTAGDSVTKAGLPDRIALALGDAASFDANALFGRADFDRIFMSYTLSMIPPWRAAIDAGAAALAPGGELHIVDFGQQEGLPSLWRRGLFAWLARFHVSPRAELREAVSQIAAERGLTASFTPLYRGYAWEARLVRPR